MRGVQSHTNHRDWVGATDALQDNQDAHPGRRSTGVEQERQWRSTREPLAETVSFEAVPLKAPDPPGRGRLALGSLQLPFNKLLPASPWAGPWGGGDEKDRIYVLKELSSGHPHAGLVLGAGPL